MTPASISQASFSEFISANFKLTGHTLKAPIIKRWSTRTQAHLSGKSDITGHSMQAINYIGQYGNNIGVPKVIELAFAAYDAKDPHAATTLLAYAHYLSVYPSRSLAETHASYLLLYKQCQPAFEALIAPFSKGKVAEIDLF